MTVSDSLSLFCMQASCGFRQALADHVKLLMCKSGTPNPAFQTLIDAVSPPAPTAGLSPLGAAPDNDPIQELACQHNSADHPSSIRMASPPSSAAGRPPAPLLNPQAQASAATAATAATPPLAVLSQAILPSPADATVSYHEPPSVCDVTTAVGAEPAVANSSSSSILPESASGVPQLQSQVTGHITETPVSRLLPGTHQVSHVFIIEQSSNAVYKLHSGLLFLLKVTILLCLYCRSPYPPT